VQHGAAVQRSRACQRAAGVQRHISLLVNNAGRFLDEHFTVTKEGIEHTIALDYFGKAQQVDKTLGA
jgi:NAD(P)-dependent dehydrogenase (short-subunit alcohol dehydrogenase family)